MGTSIGARFCPKICKGTAGRLVISLGWRFAYSQREFVRTGKDANGHPIFKAERTKVTIQDVIAAEGPRSPDIDHSQRKFNTGIVVVVERGHSPSREILERANGIRRRWIDYWATTTGHRASMTSNPR